MSIENLAQYFGAIEDPRCSGKVGHRLLDILVIAVCAVVACAESWCDIALYGRSKLAWLKTFLELANGIPSTPTRLRPVSQPGPARWSPASSVRWSPLMARRCGARSIMDESSRHCTW